MQDAPTKERIGKILKRASMDRDFREDVIHLGDVMDQLHIRASPVVRMNQFLSGFTHQQVMSGEDTEQLCKAMLPVMSEAGFARPKNEQEFDDIYEWFYENASELAYYAGQPKQFPADHRFTHPVGKVFLSWTVKSPCTRAATVGIRKSLDYFQIEYFDYTEHQLNEESDMSEQINAQLEDAIETSKITIEVMTSEMFGVSHWIQHERGLISKNNQLFRIFACLEWEVALLQKCALSQEQRILRLDMSGGRQNTKRTGSQLRTLVDSIAQNAYYRSDRFLLTCFDLADTIREKLEPKRTGLINNLIDTLSRPWRAREFVRLVRAHPD